MVRQLINKNIIVKYLHMAAVWLSTHNQYVSWKERDSLIKLNILQHHEHINTFSTYCPLICFYYRAPDNFLVQGIFTSHFWKLRVHFVCSLLTVTILYSCLYTQCKCLCQGIFFTCLRIIFNFAIILYSMHLCFSGIANWCHISWEQNILTNKSINMTWTVIVFITFIQNGDRKTIWKPNQPCSDLQKFFGIFFSDLNGQTIKC